MQKVHIIGGGTVFHIAPHLAISAPAYGKVVGDLFDIFVDEAFDGLVHCYTTRMAGGRHTVWSREGGVDDAGPSNLESNADIEELLRGLCEEESPKVIFLPAALCDFEAVEVKDHQTGEYAKTGKYLPERMKSDRYYSMSLRPAAKIISQIRKERKDIFLVGFKTTCGAGPEEQFEQGLTLLKKSSCNLVLANDLKTKMNMIITPENAPYEPSKERRVVLRQLVSMAIHRSRGHFTRSIVAEGEPVPWTFTNIPPTLKKVVDWCIKKGAYKPFLGSTVGHFAFKVEDSKFVTSRRKTNFNDLENVGMVLVEALDDSRVIAYGSRPSVGGQSQRIIFRDHPDVDCIVHFHCPLRIDGPMAKKIPIRPQWQHECGSHECGQNTSDGLVGFDIVDPVTYAYQTVKAVMLDKHGPNIVFNRDIDAEEVIKFIDENWDLSRSTSELAL